MQTTPAATPGRRQHGTRRSNRRRSRPAQAALAAVLLLAGLAADAASIRVFVHVGESGRPPVVTGADGAGAAFTDGTRHAGAAAFGSNTGAFDVAPQQGLMSLLGQSAFTTFPEWGGLLRETVASGSFEIADSFRVEGAITGQVAGFFVARVSGQLLPALDFEEDFLAARNAATATSFSRTQLLLAQRTPGGVIGENRLHDQVGSWLGAGSPCACVIGTGLEIEFVIPLLISDDSREFAFNLNVAATGTRGGGFAFGGAGANLEQGADSGLLAAFAAADPASTLSFELHLPPGLSFSSGGGNFMHLAPLEPPVGVPEPPLPGLFFAAFAAVLCSRRGRQAGKPTATK